ARGPTARRDRPSGGRGTDRPNEPPCAAARTGRTGNSAAGSASAACAPPLRGPCARPGRASAPRARKPAAVFGRAAPCASAPARRASRSRGRAGRLLQPFDRLVIERGSLGLAADRVRPDAEPFEIAFYRVGILAFRTLGVRVVEAQDEAPAALPGEQPVEQRRACIADVDAAGGRRREADGNGHGREVAEAPDADKARAWSDLETATMSTQARKQ